MKYLFVNPKTTNNKITKFMPKRMILFILQKGMHYNTMYVTLDNNKNTFSKIQWKMDEKNPKIDKTNAKKLYAWMEPLYGFVGKTFSFMQRPQCFRMKWKIKWQTPCRIYNQSRLFRQHLNCLSESSLHILFIISVGNAAEEPGSDFIYILCKI